MVEYTEWIEIKTRKPTEEEIQEYMENPYLDIDDPEDLIFFDCHMPEDGQQVLITSSWGNVSIDTYVQEYGAFEDHEDHGDVVAWAPLPKPFDKLKRNIETWIQDNDGLFHCPKCNEFPLYDADERFCRSDFCPSCGADLRTEVEKE